MKRNANLGPDGRHERGDQLEASPKSAQPETTAKSSMGELNRSSRPEREVRRRLQSITAELSACEDIDWTTQSHLTLTQTGLNRILYFNQIYQQVVGIPGVIIEFGVQWGASLSLLSCLRGIYEPFNHRRKIIGFDTFEGFPNIHAKDGTELASGDYSVSDDHDELLREVLTLQESLSPVSHIIKHEIVVGDVELTFPDWLSANEHAVIALVIFDMDLYSPTRKALELVLPRLTRGSVLVFDELNAEEFPGETIAVREVLGLDRLHLKQTPLKSSCAWGVWEP